MLDSKIQTRLPSAKGIKIERTFGSATTALLGLRVNVDLFEIEHQPAQELNALNHDSTALFMIKRLLALFLIFCIQQLTFFEISLADSESQTPLASILNVSYDATRELYREINVEFERYWMSKYGSQLSIRQSHSGSGKQARSVMFGLQADVVTLALGRDIDLLVDKQFVDPQWAQQFPNDSVPYYSTVVFLVRRGNPRAINDWDDLLKQGITVVMPNPKTSGGARWNYLAAWAYAQQGNLDPQDFLSRLYKNVPVLDSGARASSVTFIKRGIGDVLVCWENEALYALNKIDPENLEIVYPSISIKATTPVAVVNKVARKRGSVKEASEYLGFLYSETAQAIIARHFLRPVNQGVLKEYSSHFKDIKLVEIEKYFGAWKEVHKQHFADGGSFDMIYK